MDVSSIDLDRRACYRAVLSRDARFDGRFFTCVTSTGIFCRPVCPAPIPQEKNCRFHASAAAAKNCTTCSSYAIEPVTTVHGSASDIAPAVAANNRRRVSCSGNNRSTTAPIAPAASNANPALSNWLHNAACTTPPLIAANCMNPASTRFGKYEYTL